MKRDFMSGNEMEKKKMHRIGVISDTHGMLRKEVKEKLKECDVILHAGDINRQKVLDNLSQIAPVYAVRGNADSAWDPELPETISREFFGIRICMIHNRKQLKADTSDRNIIIFGHSHKYEEKWEENTLWLNPGSCGPRRFGQPVTMAVIEIADDKIYRVRKYDFASGMTMNQKMQENMRDIIQSVMRDVDQGKTVARIAQKNRISEELAEQICRLYLTHPGVDADGIINKMNLG